MEGNRATRWARPVVLPPEDDVHSHWRGTEAQRTAIGEVDVTPRDEGVSTAGRIEQLARSFRALRHAPPDVFQPWDPLRFANYYRIGSSGEKDAALFVLSVWNPMTNWRRVAKLARDRGPTGGLFDVHRALSNWDAANRAAFLNWARDPWWA